MKHYTPTLGTRDTAKNVRSFVMEHHAVFLDILNPLLPPIMALLMLDFVVTQLYFPDSKNGFTLGAMISGYFFTALVISWHRVVLDGPDRYEPVNPYKPKKHELAFLGMGILIGILIVLFCLSLGLIGALLGPAGIAIAVLAAITGSIYIVYRLSFYFPAKAINQSITLKQSYALSKGYFWKLAGSSLLASLKTIGLCLVYVVASFVVLAVIAFFAAGPDQGPGFIFNLLVFVLSLPIDLYFSPLLGLFGVTALSNYYQWAINNPPASKEP